MATSTAVSPTKLCNAATSCGMAVILIRSAMSVPITAPPTIPAMIQPYDLTAGLSRVAATATAMPAMA